MSDENQAQVRKILSIVKDPLGRYILSRCHICFGDKYLEEVKSYLSKKKRRVSPATEQEVLDNMDILGWLNLMYQKWYAAFDGALERVNRSYVDILRNARHNLSHEDNTNDFTDMDVIHVADTATRLLEAIGANEQAQITREIMEVLAAPLYGNESKQKNDEEPAPDNNPSQPPADSPKSQSRISEPRSDTNNGRGQAKVAAASVRVATKAKEKAGSPSKTAPASNKEAVQESTPPQPRKPRTRPSKRTSHADDTLQRPIRQNQGVIRFAIKPNVVIAFLILAIVFILFSTWFIDGLIDMAKDIECNPETLGRRYGGLEHAKATIGCLFH